MYAEAFYRTAPDGVSLASGIVSLLRGGEGYLYAMYSSFAQQAGRQLYPWPYSADSLLPRITGKIGDEDFLRVFNGCNDLVLWQGEIAGYPRSLAYVERNFRIAYEDPYYILWTRVRSAA